MLIQLTGHETGLPCFVESKKILFIGPVVHPNPVTIIKLDDVQGNHFTVNGSPNEVVHAIERQLGEVLTAREKQPGQSDEQARQSFNSVLDGIEKLEKYLAANSIPGFLYEEVLASIRENLKVFDPR